MFRLEVQKFREGVAAFSGDAAGEDQSSGAVVS